MAVLCLCREKREKANKEMEEPTNQNLENQAINVPQSTESSSDKTKKSLPKTVKMAILIGAVAITVIAIVLILIFVEFEHEHDWAYETIKEATCTENGIKKHTCADCEESFTSSLPMLEHEYGEYETVQSNCLMEGKKVRCCKVCGYEDSYVIPAKVSHYFPISDWTITKEATCTTDGEEENRCKECGEIKKIAIPASHQYSNGICTGCNRALINIILPNTPITVQTFLYADRVESICKIKEICLKSIVQKSSTTYRITFSWAGEQIYHYKGDNHSSPAQFAFKLYDSEGYVVRSGRTKSVNACVGEKFKDQELSLDSLKIDPNETYTLEILDLD